MSRLLSSILILGTGIFCSAFWAAGQAQATTPQPVAAPRVSVGTAADVDAGAALEEGNRLFEEGLLDEAAAAYAQGIDSRRLNPTLVYNLGTALHHAGRLPEAILWYRRGADDDPWLEENLWLARRSLGSQTLALGGFHGVLLRHGTTLGVVAMAWIWLASLMAVLLPVGRRRVAVVAAALGTILFLSLLAAQKTAPKAVVLLEDCVGAGGKLPAGTEAWAIEKDQGWAISGSGETICPRGSLEPVSP